MKDTVVGAAGTEQVVNEVGVTMRGFIKEYVATIEEGKGEKTSKQSNSAREGQMTYA